MRLLTELLSSAEGLMSLAVVIAIFMIGGYMLRMILKGMKEPVDHKS